MQKCSLRGQLQGQPELALSLWDMQGCIWLALQQPQIVFRCEEQRYPDQCLLPSPAWHIQRTLDVCSHPHPKATTPGTLCKKFIPDSALSSLTPTVSRKAAFKHVLELQISGRTPGLLVPSACAQLFARKVPQSALGLSNIKTKTCQLARSHRGDKAVAHTWALPTHVVGYAAVQTLSGPIALCNSLQDQKYNRTEVR